jgi:hypothetical protein
MMSQPDCEPLTQAVQSLAQEIQEIDFRIGALEAEAMGSNPLLYIYSQREVDRLIKLQHTLRDRWDDAMNELAICRASPRTPRHLDQDLLSPGA